MTWITDMWKAVADKARLLALTYRMSMLRGRQVALMLLLSGIYALLEGFGIGLLLPVLEYVEDGGAVPDTAMWRLAEELGASVGLEISLATLLIVAFIPVILRQVVFMTSAWYGSAVAQMISANLREGAYAATIRADLAHIENQGAAYTVGIVQGQTGRAGASIRSFVGLQSAAAISLVYFIILIVLSPLLAAFAILSTVIATGLSRGVMRKSRVIGQELATRSLELSRLLMERLSMLRLLKMRGTEEDEEHRMAALSERLRWTTVSIAVWGAAVQVIIDPFMMLAVFSIIFIGVEVLGLSLSSLGIFLFVLLRIVAKTKEFNVFRQGLSASIDSLLLIDEATRLAVNARGIKGGEKPYAKLHESIEFKDVSFGYDSDGESLPILHGLDVVLPRGTLTAIVGRSGAGKSTLVDLIPRLRDRTAGEILFDGVPIEEFDLASLRKSIGFLTQDALLFDESVRENLVYGLKETPSEEDVEKALRGSHALEIIDAMPAGLETKLGERGVRLSGGERQRLVLARELLLAPDILILDEPTSALDSQSEALIKASLDALHGTTTLIVVAHRLSTVKSADQILVLEDGRIVEQGTHEELMGKNGTYSQLFESQILPSGT